MFITITSPSVNYKSTCYDLTSMNRNILATFLQPIRPKSLSKLEGIMIIQLNSKDKIIFSKNNKIQERIILK